MDPFFRAIGSAVTVIVIFVVSVIGGRLIAAMMAKTRESQQAVTGLAAVAIFLVLFFGFRK